MTAVRSGAGEGGRDLALVQRVHGGLGLVLGPDGGHRLAGRWIFQASWSARSTVWPKISTKASITVWNVVTSSFHTMTAHRSSSSKNASMSASTRTGASMVEGSASYAGAL